MTTPFAKLGNQLMLSQALTASLEIIINKIITLESANGSLEKLAQKTLSLYLIELGFPLSFTVTSALDANEKKILVTSSMEHADCTINTSIKTLRELQAKQQLTELIKQGKLDVAGDIKVAQQFASFAENIDIDWQSELANHIGDVPTYKLMQLGKKVSSKLKFATAQIQADASEYIVHEQRLVVTKSQVDKFNRSVNDTSENVSALETRISHLEQQSKN